LQKFDVEIRDKKGSENVVADNLSRLNREDDKHPIEEKMRDDHLYHVLEKRHLDDQHYSSHMKDAT
jgi:hypothetical protein